MNVVCRHRDGGLKGHLLLPDGSYMFDFDCPGERDACFARAVWQSWWKRYR